MATKKTNTWVSCYLYYEAEADKLLANAMQPLVQQLVGEGLARQFFFIRYGDSRGPHIRLRLLPARADTRQAVVRHLKARFPDARFVAYIPETKRYGGRAGVPVAERLFEASSAAVLRLLADTGPWNQRRALAAAIQMHAGMLQAFGVSRAEASALCAHIARSGLASQELAGQFQRSFAAQRDRIVPHLISLWNACEQNAHFKDRWFADWHSAMHKTGAEIHRAHRANKLTLPETPQHDSPLWFLYESYIHMTNNRLGITLQDEPFIAYLLQKSLEPNQAQTAD